MPIVAHMPWPFPVSVSAPRHNYTFGVCLCQQCKADRGFRSPPLLKFFVRVDADGDRHTYTGAFASAVDATNDALERFGPHAAIRVKPLKKDLP